MEFSFVLPQHNSDLLDGNGRAYFVKHTYSVNEIPNQLRAANQALNGGDAFYIFDHFDTFYSVIENASKLQPAQLIRATDILICTAEKLGEMLTTYLARSELNDQNKYLNITKMVMWSMVALVKSIDAALAGDSGVDAGGKKGKKSTIDATPQQLWDPKRYQVQSCVFHLMEKPLEKLWNLSIADESFVTMVCDLGYRTLTHPSVKEKRVNDTAFHLFGVAIKQYNHAVAFPLRIMEILQRQENAVAPIARGIQLLADEYGITTVFNGLLKEFVEQLNVANPDAVAAKNFSLFLMEMAELCPHLVMPELSPDSDTCEEMLNLEPYAIRNSLLTIMGNIIKRDLTHESLEKEQKELRDYFLQDLLNHMEDVNSYVRSKVLHIWNEMKVEGAVPLAWHIRVLRKTVERLEDKTATVRKNSLTLLKSFLETNPFSAKLSIQELEAQLKAETAIFEELSAKKLEQDQKRTEMMEHFEAEIKPQLQAALEELLRQDAAGTLQLDQTVPTNMEHENAVQRVRDHLNNMEIDALAQLIITLDACNNEMRRKLKLEEQCIYFMYLISTYMFDNLDDELDVKASQVGFLSDSLAFTTIMSESVPKIETLLMSTTNTDVFEAIDFFTTGYLFDIRGTQCGVRRLLSLIWTGDKEKRNAVTKAYNRILFQTDCEGRAHHLKVVDNLFDFFKQISVGEYTAIEAMMKEWIESGVIDANIIQVFFERFTFKLLDTSDNLSRCCLHFLILASATKPSIVAANQELITAIAIGERGRKDPRIFVGCLELLMNSVTPGTKFYHRMDKTETVRAIMDIFKQVFFYPRCPEFEPVAMRTFGYFYQMCQTPDRLSEEILHDICNKLREISDKYQKRLEQVTDENLTAPSTVFHIPDYLLARLVCVFGFVASKELIFLDNDVYNNMKYREELKREKKDQKKKTSNNNKRKTLTNALNSSASDVLKRLSTTAAEPQQEPDEMLVGATAEDSIAELINQICENELVNTPDGLLRSFVPILIEILTHPGKYRNEHVQQAACTTLIRFMLVSARFCNEMMPFLMNVMDKTKSPQIKCNIIIGLSDFTCRFPNVIEPWTPNLYATLLESDVTVRLTAVKMLSHLILQEMIRVRGQLSDMAICIVDPNEDICKVTKEFFKAIKDKSNILYNVLPDIISRLSSADTMLQEDKFRTIMSYVMDLIDKDRQVESLVDKLCLRFKVTSIERQWRDIAYCLSLLRHTEKTLKKLIDHIPQFKDKIQSDEVMECFKTIITNANKQVTKTELKNIAKELDMKLQECLAVGTDGAKQLQGDSDQAGADASPPPVKGKKRGQKVVAKPRRRNNRYASSDDSDFDEPAAAERPPPKAASARNANRKAQPAQHTVVETDSDDDAEEQMPAKNRRRRR